MLYIYTCQKHGYVIDTGEKHGMYTDTCKKPCNDIDTGEKHYDNEKQINTGKTHCSYIATIETWQQYISW